MTSPESTAPSTQAGDVFLPRSCQGPLDAADVLVPGPNPMRSVAHHIPLDTEQTVLGSY